jgi:hypothetical protein
VSSHATTIALAFVASLGAAGCEATFTPVEPVVATVDFAPVATVPSDIWTYPRVYYGDSYVYLVNGAWYRPTPRGWVTFRREPIELSRQRTRIYASPRVRRTPVYGYPSQRQRPVPREEPRQFDRRRMPNPP